MTTNQDRARWAQSAVERFASEVCPDEDPDTIMGDLLANMMHLADKQGVDFTRALETGTAHYRAELAEAIEEDPAAQYEREPISPPWPASLRDLLEIARAVQAVKRLNKTVRAAMGHEDGFALLLAATSAIFADLYLDNTDEKERSIIESILADEDQAEAESAATAEEDRRKPRTMKAYLIDSTTQTICTVEYSGLPDIQRMVGGYIECANRWEGGDVLYVDYDGHSKNPRTFFRVASREHTMLAGNGLVVGREEEGEQFPNGYINHDPVITLDRLRAEVTFLSATEVSAWAKANSSEPMVHSSPSKMA